MIKRICLFILLLYGGSLSAQSYASSADLLGGYVEDGFGGTISYNHHLDRYSRLQFSVFVGISNDMSTDEEIPYNVFTFNPGYFRRILQTRGRKPITVLLGAGPLVGYEVINNGNNQLPSGAILLTESQLIFGGHAGAEVEYSTNESLSFTLKAMEFYHANSDIGNLYPFVGIGIRYYLN